MPSHAILSEIDAIFANKASKNQPEEKSKKRKNDDSKVQETVKLGTEDKKKKKKKKKNKSKTESESKEEEKEDEDLERVEEIMDPSIKILKNSNQVGAIDSKISGSSSSSKKVLLDEEELAFRDSRGTRARTDDGLPIYSVEELNIGLGGASLTNLSISISIMILLDTEACPFDCECCF
ncbi:uncharacterized protein MELLADRAFT_64994 [Melampsora larici-populina 98AG31]|uniref:Uncharacterized protein n=1 Tax=Melampsora larici-populina (strain 98AG31 / pathotype 3-4-7) TaxID=747676 RepID=F4RTJ9_MELLP|nr:uncharacterized protein MELLADRAFT_64994 [Melampsora larici-populina 98AG31]EGG04324.1 hypothetical protein MELLADRAFT_64994 [Melampsora larici-populina 98AG31]